MGFIITILLFVLIEFLTYKGIKSLVPARKKKIFRWIYYGQLTFVLVCLLISILLFVNNRGAFNPFSYFIASNMGAIFFTILVMKLLFAIFVLINQLIYLIKKLASRENKVIHSKSRRNFMTKVGAIGAVIPFFTISHGILFGKYNFKIRTERIKSPKISSDFDGFRIVQISDIHIGSFYNSATEVQEGVDLINSLNPDLVVFTGDLVNNYGKEIEGYEEVLGSIQSRYGKYAILGNHDYGDYIKWKSAKDKAENFNQIVGAFEAIGFTLLRNEHIKIKKGASFFNLLGVDNWGKPPFPQYGDLKKSMSGISASTFNILLSHDPSHWDAEVLGKTPVDLTLSGHTHGMQFGVEIGNYQWSPVKLRYPRWGGKYVEQNQMLYVNRGFGFIGFPGRIGMPPEITLFELKTI